MTLPYKKDGFLWYPSDKNLWSPGACQAVDGNTVTVKGVVNRNFTKDFVGAETDKLCPSPNYSKGDGVNDLKELLPGGKASSQFETSDLEEICEDTLRQRFCAGLIYTSLQQRITIAMNPSRVMPIYSAHFVDRYTALDPTLPAHIFNISALAYKELCDTSKSQVIFTLGRSGSGKSEAMKHILMFYTLGACADENLEKSIPELYKLLRPFVSARIEKVENTKVAPASQWSSTRAMMEVNIAFDDDQFIGKVNVKVDLLELSRVSAPKNGRNFDIFYEMAVSKYADILGKSKKTKAMTGANLKKEDVGLKETLEAMRVFEIEPEPIFEMLGGIMNLSELKASKKGGKIEFEPQELLESISDSFAIDPDEFKAALQSSCKTIDMANDTIQMLMEDTYDRLVQYIVDVANKKLVGEDAEGQDLACSITVMSSAPQREASTEANSSYEDFCFNWLTEVLEERKISLLCHSNPEFHKDVKYPSAVASRDLLKTINDQIIPTLAKQAENFKGKPIPDDDEVCPTAKALGELVDKKTGFEFVFDEEEALVEVSITHSFGPNIPYALDGEFYNRASGREVPKAVIDAMLKSDDDGTLNVLKTGAPGKEGRGINNALAVFKRLEQATGAPDRPTPWAVLCMATNKLASPHTVDKGSILDQAHKQTISTTLLLTNPANTGPGAYKEVFTAKEFRQKQDWFIKACSMKPDDDEDAGELIMEEVGQKIVFMSGGLVHTVCEAELEAALKAKVPGAKVEKKPEPLEKPAEEKPTEKPKEPEKKKPVEEKPTEKPKEAETLKPVEEKRTEKPKEPEEPKAAEKLKEEKSVEKLEEKMSEKPKDEPKPAEKPVEKSTEKFEREKPAEPKEQPTKEPEKRLVEQPREAHHITTMHKPMDERPQPEEQPKEEKPMDVAPDMDYEISDKISEAISTTSLDKGSEAVGVFVLGPQQGILLPSVEAPSYKSVLQRTLCTKDYEEEKQTPRTEVDVSDSRVSLSFGSSRDEDDDRREKKLDEGLLQKRLQEVTGHEQAPAFDLAQARSQASSPMRSQSPPQTRAPPQVKVPPQTRAPPQVKVPDQDQSKDSQIDVPTGGPTAPQKDPRMDALYETSAKLRRSVVLDVGMPHRRSEVLDQPFRGKMSTLRCNNTPVHDRNRTPAERYGGNWFVWEKNQEDNQSSTISDAFLPFTSSAPIKEQPLSSPLEKSLPPSQLPNNGVSSMPILKFSSRTPKATSKAFKASSMPLSSWKNRSPSPETDEVASEKSLSTDAQPIEFNEPGEVIAQTEADSNFAGNFEAREREFLKAIRGDLSTAMASGDQEKIEKLLDNVKSHRFGCDQVCNAARVDRNNSILEQHQQEHEKAAGRGELAIHELMIDLEDAAAGNDDERVDALLEICAAHKGAWETLWQAADAACTAAQVRRGVDVREYIKNDDHPEQSLEGHRLGCAGQSYNIGGLNYSSAYESNANGSTLQGMGMGMGKAYESSLQGTPYESTMKMDQWQSSLIDMATDLRQAPVHFAENLIGHPSDDRSHEKDGGSDNMPHTWQQRFPMREQIANPSRQNTSHSSQQARLEALRQERNEWRAETERLQSRFTDVRGQMEARGASLSGRNGSSSIDLGQLKGIPVQPASEPSTTMMGNAEGRHFETLMEQEVTFGAQGPMGPKGAMDLGAHPDASAEDEELFF